MYILKNAFKSITRAKGRNLLIGLIVLVLSVSSCIGLSIKRANATLKTQYAEDREITATLTSTDRGRFNMQGIPIDTLSTYAENKLVKNFSYSACIYFSAADGIEPLDVSGSFGQNKDFKDKYGDIENGEQITSSSTSTTTSTESTTDDDTAQAGEIINLSNAGGYILNLTNDQDGTESVESSGTESGTVSSDVSSSNEASSETTSSDSVSSDIVSSEETSSDAVSSIDPSSTVSDATSSAEDTTSSAPESSASSTTSSENNPAPPSNPGNSSRPSNSGKPSDSSKPSQGNDNSNDGQYTPPQNGFFPFSGTTSNSESNNSQKGDSDKTSSDKSNFWNPGQGNGNSTTFPQPSQGFGNSEDGESNIPGGGKFPGDTFITNNNIINNQFFFNMASMNDFTVVGYDSIEAMPEYVSSLEKLDLESSDRNCIISKSLAEENEFKVGDSFKLANPNNEDETYKFTIVGICDTAESTDSADTSSNASFTDNYIHVSAAAVKDIVAASEKKNNTDDSESDEKSAKSKALSPIYSGTYSFKNLTDYEAMNQVVAADNYSLVSEDVTNYEQSIEQLETLGGYATYFLIVIFIIGAIVLIIINLFSIRDRKYEIGVLTAIGMKKYKVATQFVIELFCITFVALIIGSGIGAVSSVPVTNGLLTTINSTETTDADEVSPDDAMADFKPGEGGMPNFGGGERPSAEVTPDDIPNFSGMKDRFNGFMQNTNNYIASVSSATDLTVIGQMILVGLGLTLISALSAVLFVMRYEPLKILSNRE